MAKNPRRSPVAIPSTRRGLLPLLEALEQRTLLSAAGGGWTGGGLQGEYFIGADQTGTPAFTRSDVRIDFRWGDSLKPGGSISTGFGDVGVNNYSVRWTGRLIARHSETYTFKAFADDAFKLEVKPIASGTWTTVIDQAAATGAAATGQMGLAAGARYDVRITFREDTGAARAQLLWSSPSTPEEVIDPAAELGFNVAGSWNQAFVDIVKSARGSFEGVDGQPRPAQDGKGWPLGNGSYVWQESLRQGLDLDPMTQGRIGFSFKGRAAVALQGNFAANSLTYSYDAATNTTTGSFVSADRDWNASYFTFRATDRDGNFGADGVADNDGITDLRMMKPVTPDAATSFGPGVIFQPQLKAALQKYTSLRVDLNNGNQERFWEDRTLPDYFNQSGGKATTRIYSAGGAVGNGVSWEHKVMLANETGRDLYVNLPMAATGWSTADVQSYVHKLAQLIRHGSDGVNPYASPQANPAYPPLNPNLRVYVELSNEYWNYGGDAFRQAWDLDAMVTADADAYLNGGVHPTGDPLARPSDFPILNYDNLPTTKNTGGAYNSLGTWRKRKMILRTVQISEIFRNVFGDAAMPGTSADPRIRPVYEWQYENANNTASDALRFMENYFNNGDGVQHVATPRPPSHYFWGGGGATYYGSGNQWGVTDQLGDPSFESPTLPAGYNANPAGGAWTFTGTAGIARDGGAGDDIPPGAKLGTASTSAQMAYITGTGAMERSFTVPGTQTSNVYSISFKSVQRGTNTQKFQVYVDGVLVNARSFSQSGGYQPEAYDAGIPWNSRVVAWTNSEYYQTLTFTAAPGSTHTIKFVGLNAGQTAFVDDVRLSSVDAIYAGGMPSGGAFAAGQTPSSVYQSRLDTQANWAAAYGLKYVTYEGGWALGGDTGGSPLQNHAKYNDPRAAGVNRDALDIFQKAGGSMNTLGTYAQWPSWGDNLAPAREGLLGLDANPLWQGQLDFLDNLPSLADNGTPLTGGTQTLTNANASLKFNTGAGTGVNADGWVSWNVLAPSAGKYNVAVDASAGATLHILVDGVVVDAFASGDALTRGPATFDLSAGLHTIRVKVVGASASVASITVTPGQGAPTGPALAVYDFAGNASNAAAGTVDSLASGVSVSSVTNGPGFRVNGQTAFANGLLVSPLNSGATANTYAQTLDASIARNEYQTFTVTPGAGKTMSLSSISLATWFQNSPAGRGVGLLYSVDGVNFAAAGGFAGAAADAPAFDLSAIAALQNVTGTVTFRVHLFGGGAYTTIGLGNRAGNDLVVFGGLAGQSNAAPTITSPAAAVVDAATGRTATLTVGATDDAGEAGLAYTWSLVGKPAGASDPTFDVNGTNGAKTAVATFAKAGTYRFLVTVTDAQGGTATSEVQVVVAQKLTAIVVSPATTSVNTNATAAFSAAGRDQFSDAMALAGVAWSVASGGGVVNAATGVYTAPAGAGSATIRATSGGVSGDAAVTIVLAAPSAPSNLAAASASSSQINLTWTDNANNETGFVVERSTDPTFGSGVVSVNVGANSTSYSATGLAAGTTFYFRVRATNAAGSSAFSNVASAATQPAATVPTSPANLAATAVSRSQVRLTWQDRSSNELGFYIEISRDGGRTYQRLTSVAANTTTFNVTNLLSNTTYRFRIQAWNDAGTSAYANTVSVKTLRR